MSKNPIIVIALVLAAGLLFVWLASFCTSPFSPNTPSGEIFAACNFPYPFSWLFGGGLQYYHFNLYLCSGVIVLILLVLFLRGVIKRSGE